MVWAFLELTSSFLIRPHSTRVKPQQLEFLNFFIKCSMFSNSSTACFCSVKSPAITNYKGDIVDIHNLWNPCSQISLLRWLGVCRLVSFAKLNFRNQIEPMNKRSESVELQSSNVPLPDDTTQIFSYPINLRPDN